MRSSDRTRARSSGWLIGFERRRGVGSRRAVTYRAIALSLALVSLFPCVSASDDSVRMQVLGAGATLPDAEDHHKTPPGQQSDKKTLGTLARLLETLDSVQITVVLVLSIVLCLFAMALSESHKSLERFLPTRGGRAPPAL